MSRTKTTDPLQNPRESEAYESERWGFKASRCKRYERGDRKVFQRNYAQIKGTTDPQPQLGRRFHIVYKSVIKK